MDSDNSTTLPLVTRRRVLTGTAIAIVGLQTRASARTDLGGDQTADPAVAVWREWQAAYHQTELLCRRQQRLERQLVETVGFPSVTIHVRDCENVTLHSLEALREVLGQEDVRTRKQAEADFAECQARWDAADNEIGFSAALRAERVAADRAENLLKVLSETHATSLAGLEAKLDAVLRVGGSSDDDSEFPWPHIRSALEDIGRLVGKQR
ncbi:hypothetical protein [Mesorhizobium sp. B1-1-8]|uniref:hypothetical protein n=1 Tax=Mesorhizobium sp. B1-1-8 TaxID=2589976 RepID=UPI001D007788|nr:hypothetical protein [Mesorhizobium sp. B1-1-8]UCI05211.1 hypothetical protein FJ974_15195 [Mesorhizobium sp. B1-1-8]